MAAVEQFSAILGTRAGRGPWYSAEQMLDLINETSGDLYAQRASGDRVAEAFNDGIAHLADELRERLSMGERER